MVDKAFRVDFYPADSFVELMALGDADAVYVLLQVRNLILQRNGPIPNDPARIGATCKMTPAKCGRVMALLLSQKNPARESVGKPVDNYLYFTEDGQIFCGFCQDSLTAWAKRRRKSQEDQQKSVAARIENKQKQELENCHPKIAELPVPYHTSTKESKNIKPIPVLAAPREGAMQGGRSIGGIVNDLLGVARSVGFNIADFLTFHELRMIEQYCPGCARDQIINTFNSWVKEEKIKVENPKGLFVDWLKKSAPWLKQTTHLSGNA